MRIDVRKGEQIKDGSEIIGARTKAKIVKNKVAPPFKTAEFDIMYGTGISHVGELVDVGVETGVIKKSGAWFYYGETRLGQGRDNVKKLFSENKELAAEIEEKIYAAVKSGGETVVSSADNEPSVEPTAPEDIKPRKKVDIDIAVDE